MRLAGTKERPKPPPMLLVGVTLSARALLDTSRQAHGIFPALKSLSQHSPQALQGWHRGSVLRAAMLVEHALFPAVFTSLVFCSARCY